MEVCRKCGEGAQTDAEIVHDLDCPTWATTPDGDVYDWGEEVGDHELDAYLATPHADCTHKRHSRSDQDCEGRQRKLRAAARALGGL